MKKSLPSILEPFVDANGNITTVWYKFLTLYSPDATGGVSNYNDLTNLPSIENKKIQGNLTLDYLNIQKKLIPGINITIDENNKINAKEYKPGENIEITEDGVINATTEGGLGRFEVGDIGISPFVDEGKNLRRLLNGQVILQSQFAGFATKLKKAVQTYPNLATTEDNWQAIKSNSKIGQCGKFVIDDTAGTIRLPCIVKLQGVLNLGNIGDIVEDGLPSITHTHTRGTMNITGFFGATDITGAVDGAFYTRTLSQTRGDYKGASTNNNYNFGFDASRSWTGSTSNNSAVDSVYGKSNTVQEEAIQYPYFIQVANGYVEDVNIDMVASKLNNDFSNAVFPIKGDGIIIQSKNKNKLVFNAGEGDNFAGFGLYGPNSDEPVYSNSFALYTKINGVFNHSFRGFSDGRLEWDNKSIAAMGMPSGNIVDLTLGATNSSYTAPANGYYFWNGNFTDQSGSFRISGRIGCSTHACAGSPNQPSRAFMLVEKGVRVTVSYQNVRDTFNFQFIYAEGDNI